MNCPICKKEMEIKGKDISNNPENGRQYTRITYWCKSDDIWVSTEIPVKRQNLA